MSTHSTQVADALEELGGVILPDNIELLGTIGNGSRSMVFRAKYRGDTVALKIYRPNIISQYRKKFNLNIAVYEMSQNRKFRKVSELLPFSAKPIMVLGHDGKQSLCFIQELLEGRPLAELAKELGQVPQSVLEAGETIARAGEQAGLDNLDLDYRNVMVQEKAGRWLPVIHDFNAPPSGQAANKAILGLFRKGPPPAYELVREWLRFSEDCAR